MSPEKIPTIVFAGDGRSGKSSLINSILTAFSDDDENYEMLARVGKPEYPGTIAFHGPFTVINHEKKCNCAYFFDSEGFNSDASSKQRVKSACKMVMGKAVVGKSLQHRGEEKEKKLFSNVTFNQFKGADLVVVVADGSKGKDALKATVSFENRLRSKHIRTMLVVTRAEKNENEIKEALSCRADDWEMVNNYVMQYNTELQRFEPPPRDPVKDLTFLRLYAQMLRTIENGTLLIARRSSMLGKAQKRVAEYFSLYSPVLVLVVVLAAVFAVFFVQK